MTSRIEVYPTANEVVLKMIHHCKKELTSHNINFHRSSRESRESTRVFNSFCMYACYVWLQKHANKMQTEEKTTKRVENVLK